MITQFLNCIERESLYGFQKLGKLSNSVCHECLGKEVEAWLELYPRLKEKFLPQVKNYAIEMDQENIGKKTCLVCKSKKVALCSGCFAHEIFNMFKRADIDKMIMMDYLCSFNFDKVHGNNL